MKNILKVINEDTDELHEVIMDNIDNYIYRDRRYGANFSIVAICAKEDIDIDFQVFKKALRKTDKFIYLSENLWCVILDSTTDKSYIKAAENLNFALQNIHYKENFYLGAASSQDYKFNYFSMITDLFDKLAYAISHDEFNMVIDQDYIV